MPYRKIVFATNEIYHIVNRGVAQSPIFLSNKNYERFLNLIDFYRYADHTLSFSHFIRMTPEEKEKYLQKLNNKILAEVLCYCLIPNHYHLLLRQVSDRGIPIMLTKLQNAFAKYFNLKHKRKGPLFQSMFQAVHIENDEQLLHVSRYIHLNPSTSYITEIADLQAYSWSSFPEYLGLRSPKFIKMDLILGMIGGVEKYKKFVFDQADYQRKLNRIKHLLLEQ